MTFKILRVGVGVVNFFLIYALWQRLRTIQISEMCQVRLKILRVGVVFVNIFFLFMRCSNVYGQFKFRKCVKCD